MLLTSAATRSGLVMVMLMLMVVNLISSGKYGMELAFATTQSELVMMVMVGLGWVGLGYLLDRIVMEALSYATEYSMTVGCRCRCRCPVWKILWHVRGMAVMGACLSCGLSLYGFWGWGLDLV